MILELKLKVAIIREKNSLDNEKKKRVEQDAVGTFIWVSLYYAYVKFFRYIGDDCE